MRFVLILALFLLMPLANGECRGDQPFMVIRFKNGSAEYQKYLDFSIKQLSTVRAPVSFKLISLIPGENNYKIRGRHAREVDRVVKSITQSSILVHDIDLINIKDNRIKHEELRVFVHLN